MNIEDLKVGRIYKFTPWERYSDPTGSLQTVLVTIVTPPRSFYNNFNKTNTAEVLVHSREWATTGHGHAGLGEDDSIKGYWYVASYESQKPGLFESLGDLPSLKEYE